LLQNFLLTGIFQLDTPPARELFTTFRPQSFSELMIFLALNRPGILYSIKRKIIKEVVQKKANKERSLLSTPEIKQILADSYGYIIFEEQISQILSLIYEYSFAEAEIRRRELPKEPLEKTFLTQAQKKMSPAEAKLIYEQISSISGYTFNKAHAAAYSYLTYYIAYLKANFFSELIVYFLNKKKEKELSYLQEAFFKGFHVKGPDINHSEIE
jgi:DNA polymerase-3 subunit alpha